MPYSHLNDFPADIRERAKRIKLACFDVDGTLTDGRLLIDAEGNESKSFHVLDGLGLKLIQRKGIAVAFVTARASAAAERRAAELGVESHTGVSDKLQCVEGIAQLIAFLGQLEPVAPVGGIAAAYGSAFAAPRGFLAIVAFACHSD